MAPISPGNPPRSARLPSPPLVWGAFGLLVLIFWWLATALGLTARIGGHLPSTLLSFTLLLAPVWGFAFGLAGQFDAHPVRPWLRRTLPLLLLLPYLVFSIPRHLFSWTSALLFTVLPLTLVLLLEWAARIDARPAGEVPGGAIRMHLQDGAALLLVGLPIDLHGFSAAWPIAGLAAFPKLLLLDATLYAFLVVRRLPGVGFDLRLRWRDLRVGAREWLFYAPFAIGIGLAIGFLHPHLRLPPLSHALAAVFATFFFVAIPEEFFFRGLLQNLLATRLPPRTSLLLTALLFGLSHFNKGAAFNGRYVLLAALAGIFYGRAWQDRRRVGCSALTHTGVDVVWSLWFR